MTFSVAARCARSGSLGIAISTAIPAVGALCSFVRPAAGAVVSQAWVNPYLGVDGLVLLRDGLSAQDTVDALLSKDPGREKRQLGVVDASGLAASFTGKDCLGWAGHRTGHGYAIQGNMLVGEQTLVNMEQAFAGDVAQELPERLMRALEAGQVGGGDRRGRQSASLLVLREQAYPLVDLRVDEHVDPVGELRRVWEVAKEQLLPFIDTLPTRDNPLGRDDPAVLDLILLPPSERVGGPRRDPSRRH